MSVLAAMHAGDARDFRVFFSTMALQALLQTVRAPPEPGAYAAGHAAGRRDKTLGQVGSRWEAVNPYGGGDDFWRWEDGYDAGVRGVRYTQTG